MTFKKEFRLKFNKFLFYSFILALTSVVSISCSTIKKETPSRKQASNDVPCYEGTLKTTLCPETDGKDFYDRVPEHPIVTINQKSYLNVKELRALYERSLHPRNAIEAEAVKHVQDWVWRFLKNKLTPSDYSMINTIRTPALEKKVSFALVSNEKDASNALVQTFEAINPYGFTLFINGEYKKFIPGDRINIKTTRSGKFLTSFTSENKSTFVNVKTTLTFPRFVASEDLTDIKHSDIISQVIADKSTDAISFQEYKSLSEEYAKDKLSYGNAVKYFFLGREDYPERLRLIESAKSSINIVAFSFGQDPINKEVLELLSKKADEGVEVKLFFDEAAVSSYFAVNYIAKFRKKNLEIMFYNPTTAESLVYFYNLKNHRLHEKYMIIDGQIAMIGGYNWGTKYSYGGDPVYPSGWRDTDVTVEGPIVEKMQKRFYRDWVLYSNEKVDFITREMTPEPFNTEPPLARFDLEKSVHYPQYLAYINNPKYFPSIKSTIDNVPAIFLSQKPFEERNLPITDYYIKLIDSAKRKIFWGCHGIRPQKPIEEALIRAAKRGVQVILMTNSEHSAKTLMLGGVFGQFYKMCDLYYSNLIKNGVQVFEWFNRGAFHSKMMIVDETVTSVGSYNIALGSLKRHSETTLVYYSPKLSREAAAQFKKDLTQSYEVVADREVEVVAKERLGASFNPEDDMFE